MNPSYDIAAYYWPAYHDDPRWRLFMPKGEGEWQIIRDSTPKFEGHLQPRVPTWGYTDESDPAVMEQKIEAAVDHGVDSLTNYQWVHYVKDTKGDYKEWGEEAIASWKTWAEEFSVPFFPHVAVGWDTNPRFKAFMENTITGGTPEKFKEFLTAAMDFVDAGKLTPPLITVNSWNEWSEGSYLEPDTTHGMGYLETVRDAIAERTTRE